MPEADAPLVDLAAIKKPVRARDATGNNRLYEIRIDLPPDSTFTSEQCMVLRNMLRSFVYGNFFRMCAPITVANEHCLHTKSP